MRLDRRGFVLTMEQLRERVCASSMTVHLRGGNERERREREFTSDPTAKGKDDNDFTTEIFEYKNSAAGEGGRDV
jgi:hypothetical protein